MVQNFTKLNEQLTNKKTRMSDRDLKQKFGTIFRQAYSSASRQKLDVSRFSSYHQQRGQESLEFRKKATKEMEEALEGLRN